MASKSYTLFMLVMLSSGVIKTLAQGTYAIQYAMSFPTYDLHDYVSQPSFRGLTVEYQYAFTPSLSGSASVGWNGFYEKENYATYRNGTEALSGIQYRYYDAVPIHLNAIEYFRPDKKFNPYGSIGLGTMFINRVTNMGLFRWEENQWLVSVKSEAGFLYPVSKDLQGKICIQFVEAFKNSKTDDQSFLSLNVGLLLHE